MGLIVGHRSGFARAFAFGPWTAGSLSSGPLSLEVSASLRRINLRSRQPALGAAVVPLQAKHSHWPASNNQTQAPSGLGRRWAQRTQRRFEHTDPIAACSFQKSAFRSPIHMPCLHYGLGGPSGCVGHHKMSDSVLPPVNRFTRATTAPRQCNRTSDGMAHAGLHGDNHEQDRG
jgi:hypothetical protein